MTLWEELQLRNFYYQCTNDNEVQKLFEQEQIIAYVGVDPTAESLHIGHFVPLLTLCHLARYGHTPIVLVGGGTAKVGDPSGKIEARPFLTHEKLQENLKAIKSQIKGIMNTIGVTPVFADNASWLDELCYIDFIRDIGRHFSVSRMLSFDTYKKRLESGLSFLEFNYQLLQAYDFLHLYQEHACTLQIGGADQWANIVAGCDLIRRVHNKETYGYTLPLVMRSDGTKMGKTEQGALFIDPSFTSPFEFYQYWRNVSDNDVIRFLKLYTFIPLDEIAHYEQLEGTELNSVKVLLAHAVTQLIHGKKIADDMQQASETAFYNLHTNKENMPSYTLNKDEIDKGIGIVDLYIKTGLCSSKSEARRLITQGGAMIDSTRISSIEEKVSFNTFINSEIVLRFGKKKMIRVMLSE